MPSLDARMGYRGRNRRHLEIINQLRWTGNMSRVFCHILPENSWDGVQQDPLTLNWRKWVGIMDGVMDSMTNILSFPLWQME